MADFITTYVEIKGTKEQVTKLIEDTGIVPDKDWGKAQKFDFNGIIKMPADILDTVSPVQVLPTEKEAKAYNKKRIADYKKNGHEISENVAAISEAEAAARTAEYGEWGGGSIFKPRPVLDWSGWANKFWGTKWNSMNVEFIKLAVESDESATLVLSLDTAWNTPRPIWELIEDRGMTVSGLYHTESGKYWFLGDGEDVFEPRIQLDVDYVG